MSEDVPAQLTQLNKNLVAHHNKDKAQFEAINKKLDEVLTVLKSNQVTPKQ